MTRRKILKILFFDTSAKVAKAFVIDNGVRLSEGSDVGEKTHASNLLPVIDEVLRRSGLGLSDIDIIGVANGPGSYTGLRISVSAAKLLAYGAGKPLVTVNTTDYLAACCGFGTFDYKVVLIDARNGLNYYSVYGKDGESVFGVKSDYVADICEMLKSEFAGGSFVFTGDGAVNNRQIIEEKMSGVKFAIAAENEAFGCFEGAFAAVSEKYNKTSDKELFRPERAAADYYKGVHITPRKDSK